jgi:hypothetical protein
MTTETERVERLVEESSYVFKATVTQINASNEPAVRPGPGLIVAHVDEAFRASPSVGVHGLRGRDVTIQLSGGAPDLGDKLIVFAKSWVYGTQIVLREVAHHKATAQAEKEVEELVERLPIRHLEARLDGAVLVVDGEVESIGPSPVPDGFSLRSPNYRLAVVRVVSTLKGKAEKHVNVLLPTNPAPPWHAAPRLKEHQNAVFVLHHETALKAPAQFYTALDPDDVQSREMLGKIKSLLKQ